MMYSEGIPRCRLHTKRSVRYVALRAWRIHASLASFSHPNLRAMSSPATFPKVAQMIPDFTLTATDGRQFRMSMFRGFRDLVLIFAAGEVPPLIAELASRAEEIEEENARVFIIAPEPAEQLKVAAHRIPVLVDSGVAVSGRFGAARHPALYITDQYGEIYSAHHGTLPPANEVLASLRHINAACPE